MGQAREKTPPAYNGLPFASRVPPQILGLLHRWLEWRTVQAAPRAVKMPEPNLRYRIVGRGKIVASRRFVLAHSTAPRDPGRLAEFNLAFWELPTEQRFLVLVYLDLEREAWTESNAWRDSLRWLGVTQRSFERQLEDALLNLTDKASQRGLL